jgi:hypothetical protein
MQRNKALLLFFVLAFTIAWVFWTIPILIKAGVYKDADISSLFGLGVGAPLLAATAAAFFENGKKGIKSLYSRFFYQADTIELVCACSSITYAVVFF